MEVEIRQEACNYVPAQRIGPENRWRRSAPLEPGRRGRERAPTSRRARGSAAKPVARAGAERPAVQISVVVANVRAGAPKAEAEKGFSRTALARESVDPEPSGESAERSIGPSGARERPGGERESGANVPEPGVGPSAATRASSETAAPAPGRVLFSGRRGGRPRNRLARRWGRNRGGAPRPAGRPERGGRPVKIRGGGRRPRPGPYPRPQRVSRARSLWSAERSG